MSRWRAGAKLNLWLRIVRRRADAFHDLQSVFHSIDLSDELEFELQPSGIDLSVEGADLPPGPDNLVRRAAHALASRRAAVGARIDLRKRIPIGAGLGGGSADAAATLLALNELWQLSLGLEELASVAETIGSDVPYGLVGGTALVEGTGERVSQRPAGARLWFVLGFDGQPLLTGDVYAAWDSRPTSTDASPFEMLAALAGGDPAAIARLLHNDLEVAAFSLRPELEKKKGLMLEAGALGAAMTGSGPTVFAVVANERHGGEVAERVEAAFEGVAVVSSRAPTIERLPST